MSSTPFAKVNRLFHAALELPEPERKKFVEEACADDLALRQRLLAMLVQDAQVQSARVGDIKAHNAQHQNAGAQDSKTEDPLAIAVQSGKQQFRSAQQPVPDQIGPFRLIRKLGQGGMGTIYLGQRADSDFEQRVAIKLLRDLDGSAFTSARLRRERRLLARLEHPNIARLIDGGELEDGTPYVAMEFVEGVNLTSYAQDHQLDLKARLSLFLQLLDSIAYAHRNLIVHRDIKPENVLVDAAGRVKLLDFGIAKLLDNPDSTMAGATMTVAAAMTPCYASPEQLMAQPVSTQSDVYSLGVVLYELLTGSLPFTPDPQLSELELQNQICTTLAMAPSKVQTPLTPQRRLRGDLDNIVLKALRKEPLRRYSSADAFADDIKQYLFGRPVSARPDSWMYRTAKLITRNPLGSVAVLLLLTTLLAFGVTSRWQANRYAAERDRAEGEAVAATQVADYMISLFQVPDPIESANRDLSAKDLLDTAAASLPNEMSDAPLLRARMMHVIGLSYANTGDYNSAMNMLQSAMAIRETELGPDSMEVSDSLNRIGNIYRMYGQLELAEQALNQALAIRERLAKGSSEELADAYNNVGLLQYQLGHYSQALITLQKSIAMHSEVNGLNTISIAIALHNRALALQRLGRYAQAESEIRQAIGIKAALGMQGRSTFVNSQAVLSSLLSNQGQLPEALELRTLSLATRRELYPQGHPNLISGLIGMGELKMMFADPHEAKRLFDEAMSWADKIDSPARSMAAKVLIAKGRLALALGDVKLARDTLIKALDIRAANLRANHMDLAEAQYLAGVAALADGDAHNATALLQEAMKQRQSQLPANHPDRREARLSLAAVDDFNAKTDAARSTMTALIQAAPASHSLRDDLITASAYRCLAGLPVTNGNNMSAQEAVALQKAAHDLLAVYFPTGHPLLAGFKQQCPGIGWLNSTP